LALRNTLFLTNVLQASGSPQQREWAAARLAVIEPNRYPFAVEALVQAARHDPHPAVRIKAIQSLALMRADSPAVRQTLQLAQNDPDPRIREQAAAALQLLGTASPAEVVPAQFVPNPR
jgi:HEAT repeat protein